MKYNIVDIDFSFGRCVGNIIDTDEPDQWMYEIILTLSNGEILANYDDSQVMTKQEAIDKVNSVINILNENVTNNNNFMTNSNDHEDIDITDITDMDDEDIDITDITDMDDEDIDELFETDINDTFAEHREILLSNYDAMSELYNSPTRRRTAEPSGLTDEDAEIVRLAPYGRVFTVEIQNVELIVVRKEQSRLHGDVLIRPSDDHMWNLRGHPIRQINGNYLIRIIS